MKWPRKFYIRCKIACYKQLSDNKNIEGDYKAKQPVLFSGKGRIKFGDKVILGFFPSPYFYSHYIHVEARTVTARIKFGSRTKVNNACTFISDTASIIIGDDCLIGTGVEIYDTDFHTLLPDKRHIAPESKPVTIGNNVFIGSNAIILKGVSVGDNSVIAHSAVVSQSVPANSIVAGNPARVIKSLQAE